MNNLSDLNIKTLFLIGNGIGYHIGTRKEMEELVSEYGLLESVDFAKKIESLGGEGAGIEFMTNSGSILTGVISEVDYLSSEITAVSHSGFEHRIKLDNILD